METTKHSSARAPGREHIPIYPNGFIAIRIALLVVAVVVLGLDAYGLSILVFAGDSLNIFTAIATLIICVYCIVAEFGAPVIYNYWAILGLDIFLVVFWLVSLAVMASEVAPFLRTYTECYYGVCETYQLDGYSRQYADCMAAVAGLGGLEFLLSIAALAIHSLMLYRHRSAGLHCMPVDGMTSAKPVGGPVPVQVVPVPVQVVPMQQTQAYPVNAMTPAPGQMYTPPPQQQQVYAGPPQQQIVAPTPYYPQQAPLPLQTQYAGAGHLQQPQ